MGLMEVKGKMALSPISSSSCSSSDSITKLSPPTLIPSTTLIPRKKRTFDIAFLTGQSETSSEATSITQVHHTSSSNSSSINDKMFLGSLQRESTNIMLDEAEEESEEIRKEDDVYQNYNLFTLTQTSATSPKAEGSSNTTNHNNRGNNFFSTNKNCNNNNNSSIDTMNNGSCQSEKDLQELRRSKYKLHETLNAPSNNNNNNNCNGFSVQNNTWRAERNHNNASSSNVDHKNNKGRKYKNSSNNSVKTLKSSLSSSSQEILRDFPKKSSSHDLSPQLNSSPSDSMSQHLQHLHSKQDYHEQQEFDGHHLRNLNFPSSTQSSTFSGHNIAIPSPFNFHPQIGRFPIHLTSSLALNNNNNSASMIPHPLSSSSTTFSPTIVNEKLSKEQHQHIISAFHHHQQQQQNVMSKMVRATSAGAFLPEGLVMSSYSPYSSYPSAAAAALLLSQDLNKSSSISNLGLMNLNSSSINSSQHNNNNQGMLSEGGSSNSSTNHNNNNINNTTVVNTSTTTTLLPPSLTSLTLPAQNVCAKCNIGFRMTSDLVYHMRSHHKREADPLKKKREDKLKCTVCLETFRERHHLTRHMTAHQDRAEEMMIDTKSSNNLII